MSICCLCSNKYCMQTIQDVQRLTYDVIHRFCIGGVWSQLLRCSFGDLTHLGSCRNPDFKARADAFTLATAASEKRPCLSSWSFMKAQCRRQKILFWTLESSFSTRFLACAIRYLREMLRFQTCGKYSSSAILSRNLVGHLWGRVMVTHNWCINEWCPQNGSANFRQLDNDCRIQPSFVAGRTNFVLNCTPFSFCLFCAMILPCLEGSQWPAAPLGSLGRCRQRLRGRPATSGSAAVSLRASHAPVEPRLEHKDA